MLFKLVILESPYGGDIVRNVEYARACMRHCLELGEAPIASHLLYTQPGILRDDVPAERQWGIEAGLAWRAIADASVFYTDLGWSNGMLAALQSAIEGRLRYEIRSLGGQPQWPHSRLPQTNGARMRHLRERLGYKTPTEFARMLGIRPARWMDAERRNVPLRLDLAQRLKEKIPGMSLDYIWAGELWMIGDDDLRLALTN